MSHVQWSKRSLRRLAGRRYSTCAARLPQWRTFVNSCASSPSCRHLDTGRASEIAGKPNGRRVRRMVRRSAGNDPGRWDCTDTTALADPLETHGLSRKRGRYGADVMKPRSENTSGRSWNCPIIARLRPFLAAGLFDKIAQVSRGSALPEHLAEGIQWQHAARREKSNWEAKIWTLC
jgi:hypothetical protein